MNTLCRLRHIGYVNYNIYRWILNTTSSYASHFGIATEKVGNQDLCFGLQCYKMLSTNTDKAADTFGTLGHENYEIFKMDEYEEMEDETRTDERLPRHRFKSVRQDYISKIRNCVANRDIQTALQYFAEMKEKRIHLRMSVYNSLIYGFAMQGDLKMCLSLFNEMKKRGIKPNSGIYVSLINACAQCTSKYTPDEIMLCIKRVQGMMLENNIEFNSSIYHALIKAYSHNGNILEALRVADEMRDKKIQFTSVTYGVLLHCALADKTNGLRLALGIWHHMRKDNVIPNTKVYNLVLECIRESNLGGLKVDEPLIPDHSDIAIVADTNITVPDLLASPPVINPLLLSAIQNTSKEETKLIKSNFNENRDISLRNNILNEIIMQNRLILFGGPLNILKKMKEDQAIPNVITVTILLELCAPSVTAENEILNYARNTNIKLDRTFYNVLIKKRLRRNDYANAQAVLSYMEQNDTLPDIITFGTLAKGCTTKKQYTEFILGMTDMGYMPNSIILLTFVHTAIAQKDFDSLDMLFQYMITNRMKFKKHMLSELDNVISYFKTKIIFPKHTTSYEQQKRQEKYNKFVKTYEKFITTTELQPDIISTQLINHVLDSRKSLRSKYVRK